MVGISRMDGSIISDEENRRQKLVDILTTEENERVLRGFYHSLLFDFIDAGGNDITLQKLRAVVIDAIKRSGEDIQVEAVALQTNNSGLSVIEVEGTRGEVQVFLNIPIQSNQGLV